MASAGHANLIPAKPGEVRNPLGRNQYSYRKDAEETFERLLASVADRGELTVSEAIVSDLLVMAQAKDKWAIDKVLERVLPAVQKHEHGVPGSDLAGLVDGLAGLAAKRRTAGGGNGADTGAEGGSR
jgi:hypothetical protein